MTRTKTIPEIQAEYEGVKEAITSLTAEQAKLQHRLTALNLLQQVKQHGIARAQTTWYVAGGGN
jgi:FtsZ-binding cell division protein ZapB